MKENTIFYGLVLPGLTACLVASLAMGRDDTDPPNGRSGLRLFTDAKTGCQYLSDPHGNSALTPRLGADGRQVCTK